MQPKDWLVRFLRPPRLCPAPLLATPLLYPHVRIASAIIGIKTCLRTLTGSYDTVK